MSRPDGPPPPAHETRHERAHDVARQSPLSPDDDELRARIAPRGRGLKGAALLLAAPLLLIGVIIAGSVAMPVREMKLAPIVAFDIPSSAPPPARLVEAPQALVAASSACEGAGAGAGSAGRTSCDGAATRAFRIDVDEVTAEHYRACIDAGRCAHDDAMQLAGCNLADPARARHPMNCVDWNEADIYCRWVGRRLPTEAEWSRAAAGDEGRVFPWGTTPPDPTRACFDRQGTCPVGERAAGATPQGVRDLAGNVWEWTSSPYCPLDRPDCESAQRAVRGGSFTATEPAKLRSSTRSGHVVTLRERYLGFRCAADAP